MPNGVPLGKLNSSVKLFHSVDSPIKGPYILYTGRIHPDKGIDQLIKSFAKIETKIPNWTLQIVGIVWDKAYDTTIKALVEELGLKKRVLFNPPAYGDELNKWYHFAEFFVLPSRHEGLANRIPESMYFRNPVIAFNVGQTCSMVNSQTGQVLRAGDIDALAKAILDHCLDEKMRLIKGETAHTMIKEEYNDEVLIPKFLNRCSELFK